MPSKNRIAAYPPDHIHQRLKDFAKEQGISESKALIQILGERFSLPTEVGQTVIHQYVTVEYFEREIAAIHDLISDLKSESLTDKEISSSDEKSNSKDESQSKPKEKASEQLNIVEPVLQKKKEDTGALQSKLQSELLAKDKPEPINHSQLTSRLGKKNQYAKSQKHQYRDEPDKLAEKLRALDPDGWGWRYNDKEKLWHPE